MAAHCSILAWEIPWIEEHVRRHRVARVRQDLAAEEELELGRGLRRWPRTAQSALGQPLNIRPSIFIKCCTCYAFTIIKYMLALENLGTSKPPHSKKIFHIHFRSLNVQSLSHVRIFVTPWTVANQSPLSLLSPGVCSNACPLSQWCHLTISSSAAPFFFWLQSFPASASASADTTLYSLLVICISFLQKWYRSVLQPTFYLILFHENVLTSFKCSYTAPF